MLKGTVKRAGIAALAVVAGCSGSTVCSGNVGPETLLVDASAFAEQPDVSDVEVCIVPDPSDSSEGSALCSPSGTPMVSYTIAESDYPAVVDYYVVLQTGPGSYVSPENGRGTHRMQCTATTTNIILPKGQ